MTAAQKAILEAVAARIVPSDECGPGAAEAGVIDYLERSLADAYASHADAYRRSLEGLDEHARSVRGDGFCALRPEAQDELLQAVERDEVPGCPGAFFELVRTHVCEGMFGDPAWGGNRDFTGWDLLGYPGLRREWTAAEQRLDVVIPPAHRGRDDLHWELP